MFIRSLLLGAAACCAASGAFAQSYKDANGTVALGVVPLTGCSPGAQCTGPVSMTNPLPVIVTGGGSSGGTVNTVASNPTSIYSAQQVCNVTATGLPSQALVNGVVIKALKSNAGTVYVGSSGVTTSGGYPLAAGESISYAVTNLSAISLICQNNSDSVAFTGN